MRTCTLAKSPDIRDPACIMLAYFHSSSRPFVGLRQEPPYPLSRAGNVCSDLRELYDGVQ